MGNAGRAGAFEARLTAVARRLARKPALVGDAHARLRDVQVDDPRDRHRASGGRRQPVSFVALLVAQRPSASGR